MLTATPKPTHAALRILYLEDDEYDRALAAAALAGAGIACTFVFAKSQAEFEAALDGPPFDLILSDFAIPSYSGMAALEQAKHRQPDVPFLLVSGTIGEQRAVESLKAGANDYVLKNSLERLPGAVQRALREAAAITERRQLEAQLRQAQKMDAVGQLAAGVAHDFNNLLAVMRGNAELVLMTSPEPEPQTAEFLQEILAASERAAKLTRQLLMFSRRQAMQPQALDLNEVIANLTKMLQRIIGEHINLRCHFGEPAAWVQADVGMMDQVLVNLVVNARDAMPQGGCLSISTESVTVDATRTQTNPNARPGEFICLTVHDNGVGIQPEHLSRLFEPFFTTKEVGKGTGLGLATVYGIIKQHQGWIEVTSQPGAGATFAIFLPAIRVPPGSVTAPGTEATLRGGTETILLVEDEPAVCLMSRRILESHGYEVLEASSGPEALQLWTLHQDRIALLLADIVMPQGMNGRDLAERLQARNPRLKVVLMSGYSSESTGRDTEFVRRTRSRFLQKPFIARALLETVRLSLDEG